MPPVSIPAVTRGRHGKDARQAALIDAATAVFADRGFDAATTREIAERAGCAEGLIHRYFGGKRGLLLAILDDTGESMQTLLAAAVPESDDLHDEIRDIMLWSLDQMWVKQDFMRVASHQSIVDAETGRFLGDHLSSARVRAFAARLKRHQAAGRVRADVDVEVVGQLISGMTYQSGFFLQVVFQQDREAVRRTVRELVHLIVRGIASDGSTPIGGEAPSLSRESSNPPPGDSGVPSSPDTR